MKALIFPNDPLIAYLKKGELKERYFNPCNIFTEIHFITFSDSECKVDEIQKSIGSAKGYIHKMGKLTFFDMMIPQKRLPQIYDLVKNIDFDIVRSYNPIYQGYYAGLVAKKYKKPFIISLHGNYDLDIRYQYFKNKDLRFFKYFFTKFFIEKKTLNMASHIIGVYKFAAKYALDNGISSQKLSIIYNRINFNYFFPKKIENKSKIKVISVGRLIPEKGQRILIDAIPLIDKNILFTIVGDGEDYEFLLKKVKEYNIENRVTFIKSIPNYKLADLYRKHDIFALPIKYGGICIPALEATACGLALVMPKPIHEEKPEIVGDYAEVVENTPEGFAKGINKVAKNFDLRKKMIEKGLKIIKNYDGKIMEKKEAELYLKLINEN